MRQFWSAMGAIILTALVLNFLFDMIRPYAAFIVLAMFIVLFTGGGMAIRRRGRHW